MDRSNSDAVVGVAQVNNAQGRSDASSNWDRFYKSWVQPIGRMLLFSAVGLAVLYALAGLSTRLFVRVDSVAWPPNYRLTAGTLGFLLIFGTAVMLPLYAMFRPFSPAPPVAWAARVIVVVIGLGVIGLIVCAATRKRWKEWLALLVVLGVAVVVAGALVLAPKSLNVEAALVVAVLGLTVVAVTAIVSTDPGDLRFRKSAMMFSPLGAAVMVAWPLLLVPLQDAGRLMAAYIFLAVVGVVLTAATLGQNLRLQVEVQKPDGTVSAGSTDYLLARMKGLGTESPKALDGATSVLATTPLSRITSEELSALPAGKVAGALSRLFFAIRPDLTWRARVTLVDEDRVAMTLSRNGRHAESAVFSRPDLGLPPIPTGLGEADRTVAQDRARAQLLTGAAAFILLRLSKAHLALQNDLYEAERWQSVALQVIATSRSLIGDSEDSGAKRVELLSRAMDEDPKYALARFEYMWAVYRNIPDDQTLYAAFAQSLDEQYERSLSHKEVKDRSWAPLRIRVKYSSATQWINGYVNGGKSDDALLENAEKSVEKLKELCAVKWGPQQLREQAIRMGDFAENLEYCIKALRKEGVRPPDSVLHPHQKYNPSPKLTWDHACLDCFLADVGSSEAEMRLGQAIEDLEFAAATDEDKSAAAADPCFERLVSKSRFRQLVGVPPSHFLGLPALAPHRDSLVKVGINCALDLVRRTQNDNQQDQLAAHLGVSRVVIDQLKEIALLAQVHPDLNDPEMLYLLIAQGVSSPAALRDRAIQDANELILEIRKAKEVYRLDPPGLRPFRPRRWLRAART